MRDRQTWPFASKMLVGAALLTVSFIVTMVYGAANESLREVWLALFTHTTNESANVIREIRLPREVGAVLVGAALSVAGAVMQGLTRNPLADPGLLGLTAGANAALAIVLAWFPGTSDLAVTVVCFVGAALGTLLVVGIGAARRGRFSPLHVVLAGAAVTVFLDAAAQGISIASNTARDVSVWTAGGLVGTTWSQVRMVAPFIAAGIVMALVLARQLTVLSLDEEVALGLGQRTGLIRLILYIVVTLLAGASVALVGNIAFFGLMIPHLVRPFVGTDYRYVLPMSALVGASFMSLADTLGRVISAPYETPVIAIIAVFGLPFFLFVVRRGVNAFS
ncbi:ferrichrome ABC transporter permease [Alicyclobacillus contaminans]|uniref:FecCD family ABC transporter permease n=1 Tax=Alicyclobacillus contaminans TaxID=392016 RepID=UPI00040A7192|nr:iron ABC transporter permease [Alicyclobacillus contaminans]GMA52251.1 ferrichrome ABC transporter permease [Alicyclobacillus contaminans]